MSSGDGGTNPLGVIEGYQVFCNPEDQAGNTTAENSKQSEAQSDSSPAPRRRSDSSDSEPPVHFQVKAEPVDAGYEQAANSPASSDNNRNDTPPPSSAQSGDKPSVQISSSLWSGSKKTKETKKPDASVSNVIEQLLRKNEYLLAQNDAGGFKPNPRKSRNPNEMMKKPDNALDSNGTTFLVSQTSQARISKAENPPSKNLGPGRILRPRSPTRKCSIPEKDKSHFNHAVMESKVNDKSSEKIFRVNTHEMVCAVSCRAMFMTQGGSLVANFDLHFYWCNFCPYHTTTKAQLLQHVMEHRFHCKFCRYQSFSRADVIHHTAETHSDFSEAAASLKYCTLLSDYLQIYSQDTEEDKKKRAGGGSDDEPPSKISKVDAKNLSGLYANIDPSDPKKMDVYNALQKDYEYFDMEVETVDGNIASEEVPSDKQVMGGQSTYDVSKNDHKCPKQWQCHPGSTGQVPNPRATITSSASFIGCFTKCSERVKQPVSDPKRSVLSHGSKKNYGDSECNSSPQSPCTCKPFENRPPPPPPPPNKMRSGSSVSSNLYWSCGYCNFTSHSQGEIKEHSQKTHRGRPHRYVALIRPPEKKPDEADGNKNNSSSSTVTSKDIEIDHADDSVSADTSVENSKKLGEPPTYKCFHCFYEVKKPGLLKGHMSYKHRGLSLVGFDVHCESPDKYMYFCPRDDCPFRAKNPTAYLNHVERCTPWHNKDLNVTVEPYLLKCLDNTVQLAEKMKEQVRTTEEYSCIYCTFTGCFLENVAYHITMLHANRSVIVKDLVLRRLKRKCFIYRCRVCDWENRDREEWIEHGVKEHQLPETDFWRDVKACYAYQSGKKSASCKSKLKSRKTLKSKRLTEDETDLNGPPILSPEISVETDCVETFSPLQSVSGHDSSPPSLMEAQPELLTNIKHEQGMPKMVSILPPVLQCSYCDFSCIGIVNVKEHLQSTHAGQVLAFYDMQKKAQKIPSYFYLCPFEKCIYSGVNTEKVCKHNEKVHASTSVNNGCAEDEYSPPVKLQVPSAPRIRRPGFMSKSRKGRGTSFGPRSVSFIPAMLKCQYCGFSCIGVLTMKEHLMKVHEGEPMKFVNLRKRKQKSRSIFHICSHGMCPYTHTDVWTVDLHYSKEHSGLDDYPMSDMDPSSEHHLHDPDLANSALFFSDKSDTVLETNEHRERNLFTDCDINAIFPSTSATGSPSKYCCLLCESNFFTETKQDMKDHYKDSHPDEDIVMRDLNARKNKLPSRWYVCREASCLHHFLDAQALLLHQLAHSHSPVFECSECHWCHPKLMKVMDHLNDFHDNDDADILYINLELEEDGRSVRKVSDGQAKTAKM
ncbi:LOW QUALITY PROTEIN: uncharacterized protein LOC124291572 [Haliotis rubra]|uniref:LOW QUALITY PROTEIN: uncharacterized protein LOC124291572 n=1 Tax=Haliotis rubra TaxID=36100 RepID=UPI001EE5E002|nr:LOW QUALITY PROTEIN: uncharacterized protein LOC124291572 [Haliotis rubra]